MFGVVTSGFPYLLVLELCEKGELLDYVRAEEHPADKLVAILLDVAAGMAHLAKHHFVHRDLATRNVLLDGKLTAKIADFGLGRDVDGSNYYRPSDQAALLLPLRWSDPEVLESNKFNEKTAVWSFGITAMEVLSRPTAAAAAAPHAVGPRRLHRARG